LADETYLQPPQAQSRVR